MSRLPSALFLSSLVTFAAAADPPAPPPEDIVFPAAPVPPTPPAPKPAPGAVATLGADQLYVVTSKTECVVRAHPAGLVKIEKQAGPVTIRGKFVDGNGKVQTKKFAAPFVYVLEAAGTGRAEIDVIPLGLKAEADIKTAMIDVDSGQGPIPPPKPVPPPDAQNPFGALPGLHVLIVYESDKEATLPVPQFLILRGKKFREYLDAKCAADGYRVFDQNVKWTKDEWWSPALKKTDRTSLPWIYVGKESVGYSGLLPADADAAIALIAKYAGN